MLGRVAESDRARRNAEERSRVLAGKVEELEAQLDAIEQAHDVPSKPASGAPRPAADAALLERISGLESALRDAERRVQDITSQRDGFERAMVDGRDKASSTAQASRAAAAALERELADTRSNLEAVAAQLRDASAARDAASAARDAASAELRAASARKTELERQIVEGAADCDAQTRRADALAAKMLDAEKQIEALAGELARTKQALAELAERADATARELARRESDVDHARAARDAIERVADARADAARSVMQLLAEMSERDAAAGDERAKSIAKVRELLAPSRESLPPGTRAKGLRRPPSLAPDGEAGELSLEDSELLDDET